MECNPQTALSLSSFVNKQKFKLVLILTLCLCWGPALMVLVLGSMTRTLKIKRSKSQLITTFTTIIIAKQQFLLSNLSDGVNLGCDYLSMTAHSIFLKYINQLAKEEQSENFRPHIIDFICLCELYISSDHIEHFLLLKLKIFFNDGSVKREANKTTYKISFESIKR